MSKINAAFVDALVVLFERSQSVLPSLSQVASSASRSRQSQLLEHLREDEAWEIAANIGAQAAGANGDLGILGAPIGQELGPALLRTGVAAYLLQPDSDRDSLVVVAEGLANYVVGPRSEIFQQLMVDINMASNATPILIIDGWELRKRSFTDLKALLPVSSVAHLVDPPIFVQEIHDQLSCLERRDNDQQRGSADFPPFARMFELMKQRQWERYWQPLFLLGLFANPPVSLRAQFRVEPGHLVERYFDSVEINYESAEDEEHELGRVGNFRVDANNADALSTFCSKLSPLIRSYGH